MDAATDDVDTGAPMDAATIIRKLTAKGVCLGSTSRGTIQVSPASGLSAADRALILGHKPELLAELQKREHVNLVNMVSCGDPAAHTMPPADAHSHRRLPDGRGLWLSPPETVDAVQARYPGAMPWTDADAVTVTLLTETETSDLRAWLAFIGETDPATVEDVLRACERSLTTRAHWLREARFTEARQVIATRAASETFEERAAILEYDGGLSRKEAERIAQLSAAFYNHLMARTGCCYAPHDRYCPEGQRLRDVYYEAAKAAGKLT
ncbi:MAG: hypothetical protein ACYCVY_09335 [Acidiferrobacteraceae bacterium]